MSVDRIPFGIRKLDEALNGGIPKKNIVLLSGGAGTGKSTLGLHFLFSGVRQNENCLYISTEQNIDELEKQCSGFEPKFRDYVKKGNLKILFVDVVSEDSFLEAIFQEVDSFKPNRIMVDSLSTFSEFAGVTDFARQLLLKRGGVAQRNIDQIVPSSLSEKTISKKMLGSLIGKLRGSGATVLLTSELPEKGDALSSDGISEFLADGVIMMELISGFGKGGLRNLRIRKMRYTGHVTDSLPFEITTAGITVGVEG